MIERSITLIARADNGSFLVWETRIATYIQERLDLNKNKRKSTWVRKWINTIETQNPVNQSKSINIYVVTFRILHRYLRNYYIKPIVRDGTEPADLKQKKRSANGTRLIELHSSLILNVHVMAIDTCLNKISADSYNVTILRAQAPVKGY